MPKNNQNTAKIIENAQNTLKNEIMVSLLKFTEKTSILVEAVYVDGVSWVERGGDGLPKRCFAYKEMKVATIDF
jgi:hypothetical protein